VAEGVVGAAVGVAGLVLLVCEVSNIAWTIIVVRSEPEEMGEVLPELTVVGVDVVPACAGVKLFLAAFA